jgi:hypothetical protein
MPAWALGLVGTIYGAIAAIVGAIFIALAIQVSSNRDGRKAP